MKKTIPILIVLAVLAFAYLRRTNSELETKQTKELNPAAKNSASQVIQRNKDSDFNAQPKEQLSSDQIRSTLSTKAIPTKPVAIKNLPQDFQQQLNSPPPPLPDDLQRQLQQPAPELPEDIKQALETKPRQVSAEEVNGFSEE